MGPFPQILGLAAWLLVGSMADASLRSPGFQSAESAAYYASDDSTQLERWRQTYILYPDFLADMLADRLEQGAIVPTPRRLRPRSDRLEAYLDSLSRSITGKPFLGPRPQSSRLIDSLRIAFYLSPLEFTRHRVEHLNHVTRQIESRAFIAGNNMLARMLEHDRYRYFHRTDSFSVERLDELKLVSLRVTSLPFLRGNPMLTARLEEERKKYKSNRSLYDERRLNQLNDLSLQVLGHPFEDGNSWSAYLVLGGLAVGVILVMIVVGRSRRGVEAVPHKSVAASRDAAGNLTVEEACRILGVEPHYTRSDLDRAYRSQQKRYHPDVVAHLGPEFRDMAERKSRDLNEAYQLLKKRI